MGSGRAKRRVFHALCVALIVAGNATATVRYDCPMTGARQQTRCCCPTASKTSAPAREADRRPCHKAASEVGGAPPCATRTSVTVSVSRAACCEIDLAGPTPYVTPQAEYPALHAALPETAGQAVPVFRHRADLREGHDLLAVPLQILFCSFLC